MTDELSIQERHAPRNACFGCGPANEKGLGLRSFPVSDEETVAEWTPEKHHEAFDDVLAGGVIGALLDCHMNWTAAWHLMKKHEADGPPCTVTAEYSVQLRRPCPTDGPVTLRSKVVSSTEDRAEIEYTMEAGGKTCARGSGTFVAVKEGHPAYHRW
ncbi:MAG: PaaI family thioesterase [Acidobacteriota bacterium]